MENLGQSIISRRRFLGLLSDGLITLAAGQIIPPSHSSLVTVDTPPDLPFQEGINEGEDFVPSPLWGQRVNQYGELMSPPKEVILHIGPRRPNPRGSEKLDTRFDMQDENGDFSIDEARKVIQELKGNGIDQILISTWETYGLFSDGGNGETFPNERVYKEVVKILEEEDMTFMPYVEVLGKAEEISNERIPEVYISSTDYFKRFIDFIVSYVRIFGDSIAWAKNGNMRGETNVLPFKLSQFAMHYLNERSEQFIGALDYLCDLIQQYGGQKVGFWVDTSSLSIDTSNPFYRPVDITVLKNMDPSVAEVILGSSELNPAELYMYYKDPDRKYRDDEGFLTNDALEAIYEIIRKRYQGLVDAGIPFYFSPMLGYDSTHIPWYEDSDRWAMRPKDFFEFNKKLMEEFVGSDSCIGFTGGLGNNTTEHQSQLQDNEKEPDEQKGVAINLMKEFDRLKQNSSA